MRQDQGGGQRPTVGDTVTVVHRIAAPPGALVEPRGPADSTLATLVAPPDVRREGDSVRIAYALAVWAPGRRDLVLPGPIVVRPDGTVDTLPAARVALDVASVLPEGARPEAVAPQAARPWVPAADRTAVPVALLLALALLGAAAATWWWRRRGPLPPPEPAPEVPPPDPARLRAWLAAGEAALVADHLAAHLAGPAADAWRARVAAVRFAPGAAADLAALAEEGLGLLDTHRPGAAR